MGTIYKSGIKKYLLLITMQVPEFPQQEKEVIISAPACLNNIRAAGSQQELGNRSSNVLSQLNQNQTIF